MNVLITGGTGLLGQRLITFLSNLGMNVRLVSRSANKTASISIFEWNIRENRIDPDALAQVDVVIHLAGANVAEARWTAHRKKEILESRVQSTAVLFDAVERMKQRPKVLICASATGYYGIQDFEHVSFESEKPGEDFLAQVCQQWEIQADRFSSLGMRVIKVRTGVVFDQKGGALPKIAQPIRYFFGASLGSGKQYINWIHWKDWCGIIQHFLSHEHLKGAFNATAPEPVTNAELTRLIAREIHRPLWLPKVPGLALKLLLGEMSSVVLEGHSASSKALEKTGYQFEFVKVEQAIGELLGRD